MSLTTATRLASAPRVNLLPPEIGDAAKLRRLQVILVGCLFLVMALIGAVVSWASGQVGTAQDGLTSAQAQQAQLRAETVKYANVPIVYAAVANANSQLTLAMGQEVQYSYILRDLSLNMPKNVWLEQMNVVQNVGAAPGAAPVTGSFGEAGVATVTVSGDGLTHNDVTTWLEMLAKQKYYVDPNFTVTTEDKVGSKPVVKFQSDVTVSSAALSGRYAKSGG